MIDGLKELGLFGLRNDDKFVPTNYLWSSIDQRLDLLSGLLDSDGSTVANGGFEFSNISFALCEAVVHLAQSLGGIASIAPRKVRENEKPCWRVRGRIDASLGAPFRLTRKRDSYKIHKYEYCRAIVSAERVQADEAICIKVDRIDGLFLTEGFVVTHNTDFVTPLSWALDKLVTQYKDAGQVKGDIVFCTDGMCGVPEQWLKEFKDKQAELGFRVWGIVIGGSPQSEPLVSICDGRVLTVSDLLSANEIRSIFNQI